MYRKLMYCLYARGRNALSIVIVEALIKCSLKNEKKIMLKNECDTRDDLDYGE